MSYIKIKKANLEPDKWGNRIVINMIGFYDKDNKWIKWIKLEENIIKLLIDAKINFTEEQEI